MSSPPPPAMGPNDPRQVLMAIALVFIVGLVLGFVLGKTV